MWLLLLLPTIVFGQKQAALDPAAMAENVDNIRRLYGIATRIMELSGDFMARGSSPGSGGPWDDTNQLQPRFQSAGVRTFESDNTVTGGNDGHSDLSRFREDFGLMRLLAPALSPVTTTTTPKPFQAGIQGLLNTFFDLLGQAVLTETCGEFHEGEQYCISECVVWHTVLPNNKDYTFGKIFALARNKSVNKMVVNLSSKILSGSSVDNSEPLPTPPTPRPRQPANILSLLGTGSPPSQQPQTYSKLGQINLWELFGVTPRTTTTTLAPLQRLLDPKLATGNTQNIDAVLNALMRSNAQPDRPQASSNLFSQFFGRK